MIVSEDAVSFVATSSGTVDFVYGGSRTSFANLTSAVTAGDLVDGQWVSYTAVDSLFNPTQREFGQGIFSAAGSGTIARTNPLGGTSGAGTKVNFGTPPIVSLTILAEDVYYAGAGEVGSI
jgi:hypothetical protein